MAAFHEKVLNSLYSNSILVKKMPGQTILVERISRKATLLEKRLKRIEQYAIPVVRLSDKEMTELEHSRRQIKTGHSLGEKELFKILGK